MVHALQQVHSILQPNGVLINVYDLPTPQMIEVRLLENVERVGFLTDSENYEPTIAAFNALAQVVADGYFNLEEQQDFSFNIYADYLKELQDWLAEWWSTAIIPTRSLQRIEELMQDARPRTRIVLALRARMIKLRVV